MKWLLVAAAICLFMDHGVCRGVGGNTIEIVGPKGYGTVQCDGNGCNCICESDPALSCRIEDIPECLKESSHD